MALKLSVHSLPDTKVQAAKDPGKNYINVRPSWSAILGFLALPLEQQIKFVLITRILDQTLVKVCRQSKFSIFSDHKSFSA